MKKGTLMLLNGFFSLDQLHETNLQLIICKPNICKRKTLGMILGELIVRLTRKDVEVVAMKMLQASPEQIEQLYAIHKGKDFYKKVKRFMLSGEILVLIVRPKIGSILDDSINFDPTKVVKEIIGPTNPKNDPQRKGMRARYCPTGLTRNGFHKADSPSDAYDQMIIFFSEDELIF